MDWHMTLHGSGPDAPAEGEDAPSLLARFVDELKARGHEVADAMFNDASLKAPGPAEEPEPAGTPAAEEPAAADEPFGTESEPQVADAGPAVQAVPGDFTGATAVDEPVEEAGGPDSDDSGGAEVGADPGAIDSSPPAGA